MSLVMSNVMAGVLELRGNYAGLEKSPSFDPSSMPHRIHSPADVFFLSFAQETPKDNKQ